MYPSQASNLLLALLFAINAFSNREGRKEIDLVGDGVENSLMREVDKIKNCQARMSQTLEQVNYQLGVNKECRHQLERDLANKDHGINIDNTVHQMRNTSRAINLHGGIEKVMEGFQRCTNLQITNFIFSAG